MKIAQKGRASARPSRVPPGFIWTRRISPKVKDPAETKQKVTYPRVMQSYAVASSYFLGACLILKPVAMYMNANTIHSQHIGVVKAYALYATPSVLVK